MPDPSETLVAIERTLPLDEFQITRRRVMGRSAGPVDTNCHGVNIKHISQLSSVEMMITLARGGRQV